MASKKSSGYCFILSCLVITECQNSPHSGGSPRNSKTLLTKILHRRHGLTFWVSRIKEAAKRDLQRLFLEEDPCFRRLKKLWDRSCLLSRKRLVF